MNLMMQPGPTQIDHRVYQAIARPAVYHAGPVFENDIDETASLMQQFFGTSNEVVILPATGRGGIEGAFSSVWKPGKPVVVLNGGVFGNLSIGIVKSLGLEVIDVSYDPQQGVDYDVLEKIVAEKQPQIVAAVHVETSTGIQHDIARIAQIAKRHGALSLIDAVASIGGIEIKQDEREIDIVIGASQKGIGSLAGMSAVSLSSQALEAMFNRGEAPRPMYLDLLRWWIMWLPKERGGELRFGNRRMPWTMNTHGVFALQAAGRIAVNEEGLENRYQRHEQISRGFKAAIKALGFKFLTPDEYTANTVTAALPPEGITAAQLIQGLSERHEISIAGGLEQFKGMMIRVGHMAETARSLPAISTLNAIAVELRAAGLPVDEGYQQAFYQELTK